MREVQLLSGGYLNDVFRIETGGGRYALRLGVATTSLPMVEWELDVLAYLAERGQPVPSAVPARDGSLVVEHEGRPAVMLTFMEGEEPDRFRREHRLAAAQTLAQIHRALASFDAPPRAGWTDSAGAPMPLVDLDWLENRLWSWHTARTQLLALDGVAAPADLRPGDVVDEIEHHLDAVGARAAALRSERLPMQVIHGDYWAGNLRVAHDRVVGVFDWDDTRHDWRALEVGRATWEFCRNAALDDLDAADVDEFVDAYVEAGGEVLPSERAAFPVLIAVCRITETLYDFALDPPAQRTEEDWRYLAATLRLLRTLDA